VRQVVVQAGQKTEIRVRLRTRVVPAPVPALARPSEHAVTTGAAATPTNRAAGNGVSGLKRIFGQ
jgi:hypothetical protein